MLSDEEIVEKVRLWKRMSANLISRRFKINTERALRIEAIILSGKSGPSGQKKESGTLVLPKKLFTLARPRGISLRHPPTGGADQETEGLFHRARPSKLLPYLATFSVLLFLNLLVISGLYFSSYSSNNTGEVFGDKGSFCSGEGNIAVIPLIGELVTTSAPYSDFDESSLSMLQTVSSDVVEAVQKANHDPSIVAIVLSIDSHGGSPVGAEEVEKALRGASKPTVALIRGQGLSAAYWVATGASAIFASALSDVGSIGVTASYVDNAEKNKKEGLTYNSISSGGYKETGDPNKPLSLEERELILRDVDRLHDIFVKKVAENRKQDVSVIESLADGSSLLGEEALSVGLIDGLGGMEEVLAYVINLPGKNNLKNLSTCQYYKSEKN